MVKLLLPANQYKFPDFSLIFLVLKFTDFSLTILAFFTFPDFSLISVISRTVANLS